MSGSMFPSSKEQELQFQQTALTNGDTIKKRSAVRRAMPQIIATTAFGMLIFSVSAICTMATVVIGALYKEDGEFPITYQQASWFGSVVYIVQPFGSLTSGFIQDTFGRKKCMMGVTIPQLIGWIILYFSTNVSMLYAAAIIMGLSVGFMEAPAMSYLGEVCEPRLRGTLSSFSEIFLLIGIAFEFCIGALLYWRYACLASGLVPISVFLLVSVVPESPTWLVFRNREADAEKAMRWLRGWVTPQEVQDEMAAIVENVKSHYGVKEKGDYQAVKTVDGANEDPQVKIKSKGMLEKVKLLKEPRIHRPVILVATFFFVGHCTSLIGLRPFLVKIFNDLETPMTPYLVLVLSGALQVTGAIVCAIFIHKVGKRKIAFVSLGGATLCCFLLAAYIVSKLSVPWIPVALFAINFFCGGLGIMPLPWVLVCEIFPLDGRGIAAGIAAASSYVFAFIITKTFVDVSNLIELPGVIFVYGIVGVLGFVFLFYRMPETEGKTLAEIEVHFKTGKYR